MRNKFDSGGHAVAIHSVGASGNPVMSSASRGSGHGSIVTNETAKKTVDDSSAPHGA